MDLSPYLEIYTKEPRKAEHAVNMVKANPKGAEELRNALKVRAETDTYNKEANLLDNVALLTKALDVYYNTQLGRPPLEHHGEIYKLFAERN